MALAGSGSRRRKATRSRPGRGSRTEKHSASLSVRIHSAAKTAIGAAKSGRCSTAHHLEDAVAQMWRSVKSKGLKDKLLRTKNKVHDAVFDYCDRPRR